MATLSERASNSRTGAPHDPGPQSENGQTPEAKNGHQENIELMSRMGSTKGYDPIPPDQYLSFLGDKDPTQRVLAWVRSKTIRFRYRSAYCVDEHGQTRSLSHMAADLHMDLGHACRIWSQLEAKGLVAKDEIGKLWLCGKVSPQEPQADPAKVDCTVKLPKGVSEQIQRLSPERRAQFERAWHAFSQFSNEVDADLMALGRALKGPIEARVLASFGIQRRPGKKRRKPTSSLVEVRLLEVPEFIQSTVVQCSESALHNAENGPVQWFASLLNSEGGEVSSSSSGPAGAGKATATNLDNFADQLVETFVRAGKPSPTARQAAEVVAELPDTESRQAYLLRAEAKVGEWKHPGVLKSDVAAFMRGWPAEKRRQAQVQEEAEAARLRYEQEKVERVLWIKEKLLANRYADTDEIAHFLEQYPELRGYNPPPEHFRAVDRCHVRLALMEIGRTNCPPDEKQRQRGRLAELEQIWPGIVDEVKREDGG